MRWSWSVATGALVIGWTLACGGASIRDETLIEAEALRSQGDFKTADGMLRYKVQEEPDNSRAWRLLGDVQITRGERFKKRWKENLVMARESYYNAVIHDTSDCGAWARLAFVVAAAAEEPSTRIDVPWLDALPLDEGWEQCPGAGLLALEEAREPSGTLLDEVAGRLGKNADEYLVLANARPDLLVAWQVLSKQLAGLAFKKVLRRRPKPKGGGWFVIIEGLPVQATGVGGASSRKIRKAFASEISAVRRKQVTFLDRGFARRVPELGWVATPDCPGSHWNLSGPDNVPTGSCVGGPVRRGGTVYNGDRLKAASDSHWREPAIRGAIMPRASVADARCSGGRVGRLLVDVATCAVTYDKLVPQKRSVDEGTIVVAASADHAQRMLDAYGMSVFYGPELAKHLQDGEVAAGLPYTAAWLSLESTDDCRGRKLLNHVVFEDALNGPIGFSCLAGDTRFLFKDMALASWGRAG